MWTTQGPPRVAAFGKIPRIGDFLRVGSVGPSGEAFKQWMEHGLGFAESGTDGSWLRSYQAGATYAFVFRPPSPGDMLVGVIKPSVDSVGRRFPLAVYAPAFLDVRVPWPHVLPIVFGDFLDAAATVLQRADSVSDAAEMHALLQQLPPPHRGDGDLHASEYDAWAASTAIAHAWGVVYGAEQAVSAAQAVHTIAEAVAPFRGDYAPRTKLGLRLPLGPGGVAAAVLWLDTIGRLAQTPGLVRNCFWCFDGTSGSAIVQLGDVPASTLAQLWAPNADSEHLCDLTSPSAIDVARYLTRLPGPLCEALQSSRALVREFLERLSV